MANDLRIDDVLIQVRAKLQENGIKLWEPPYFIDPEPQDEVLEDLGRNFSAMLQMPVEACIAAVKELQNNALDKLAAKAKFNATGIASLKIRVPNQPGGTQLLTVEVNLSKTGDELQHLVAQKINVNRNRVKLISAGIVIDAHRLLSDQKIANNQQLMALILPEQQSDNDIYDRTAKIKADAELLIKNRNSDYMQMEDQEGNAIYLPTNERRSLMMGLALHEKGRVVMNRENYAEALVLFLEADSEFNGCQSKLLESVDNYALLNLDIVWCYLCLKSVTQLPDAERRLKLCEDNFRRSYGANFDRVIGIKGSECNEKALVMRLHLLQAILCFHQNRRSEAQGMLALAESELMCLKVDESSLTMLIEMGYTVPEARIALRATGNDIEKAICSIMQRRETKREARKKASDERELLGRGFKGGAVNPNTLKKLIEMGFNKELAAAALEKCDNDIANAVNMLQEKSEELQNHVSNLKKVDVEAKLLENLQGLGFDLNMARKALEQSTNNLDGALDYLLKLQQNGTYDTILNSLLSSQPGSSTSSNITSNPGQSLLTETFQQAKDLLVEKRNEAEAFQRFKEDMSNDDDDYLDLPLIQEENLILEYKQALDML